MPELVERVDVCQTLWMIERFTMLDSDATILKQIVTRIVAALNPVVRDKIDRILFQTFNSGIFIVFWSVCKRLICILNSCV